MPSAAILQPFLDDRPTNFETLAASCGNVIDAWLAEGGEPTDDEIFGFYGLWSQSLDARGNDEVAYYHWAYPLLLEHFEEARARIQQN